MLKNNRKSGIPVLGQLLSFIPRDKFFRLVSETGSDHYTKRFKSWDHLVTLLFAVIHKVGGLRELCSGLSAHQQCLKHLGMGSLPFKSTISDANKRRTPELFEKLFSTLYSSYYSFFSDSSLPRNEKWLSRLYLVDSSTITLFKNIMKACGNAMANGRKKGGVKIHTGMSLLEKVPSVIKISKASENDRKFLSRFKNMPALTIMVFDKAYLNYSLFNHWTKTQVSYVSRLHRRVLVTPVNLNFLKQRDIDYGVIEDGIVMLGHLAQKQKVKCRLIKFHDKVKNQFFEFITNDMKLEAWEVCEVYRQRWQIEILFKRLKQNLKITSFLGDNENAIRIQIWCALIADMLIQIARKGAHRTKIAYSVVCGLFRLHLMNYVKVGNLLSTPSDPKIFDNENSSSNFTLFGYSPP